MKNALFSEVVIVAAASWRQQVSNLMIRVRTDAVKKGVTKLIMVVE